MNALSPLAAEMVAEDPAASSLTRSALSGVLWNWAGSAVLVVAQIASTAATARLVAPRDFGIYATAQAASGFAGYFAMAAIGSGLLRRAQLGAKTVGTAMVLSLGSALLVALVLVSGAPLWARAWGVPDAARLVRVVAFTLFLTSAATVPIALIRRRLQFRRAAIVETGTQLAGLAAGVALAVELHSALALALGQAVGAATLLVVACALARDVLRLSFDRADARELLTFSGQVGVLGLSAYAVEYRAGVVRRPRVWTACWGSTSRANLIVSLPLTYAASSMTKVLYPLYGRVRDDFARTRTLLDEALMLTTGLAWPLFALVARRSARGRQGTPRCPLAWSGASARVHRSGSLRRSAARASHERGGGDGLDAGNCSPPGLVRRGRCRRARCSPLRRARPAVAACGRRRCPVVSLWRDIAAFHPARVCGWPSGVTKPDHPCCGGHRDVRKRRLGARTGSARFRSRSRSWPRWRSESPCSRRSSSGGRGFPLLMFSSAEYGQAGIQRMRASVWQRRDDAHGADMHLLMVSNQTNPAGHAGFRSAFGEMRENGELSSFQYITPSVTTATDGRDASRRELEQAVKVVRPDVVLVTTPKDFVHDGGWVRRLLRSCGGPVISTGRVIRGTGGRSRSTTR